MFLIRSVLRVREDDRISGVAVKCVDIRRNTIYEGGHPAHLWRSSTKAWVANRIRYPGSPRPKRCMLGVVGFDPQCRREPDKHTTWGVRSQGWNSKELTGARTSGGSCGLIRCNAKNLTRARSVRSKKWKHGWGVKSPAYRGAAWLSSARVVRCWVKSRNERNPYSQLL